MNLTQIQPYLLNNFKSEQDLVKSIQKLSENFTSNRDKINDYHEDEKLIAAYAAFYLTTNYPKFSYLIEYLSSYKKLFQEYELIDIGVGPGTFIFAIGDYFEWDLASTFWGVETSHLMRKQAAKIREGLYADRDIEIVSKLDHIPKKADKKRMVIFTHSFNEMKQSEAMSYIEKLEADAVLFIEPGTKELFKSYVDFRDLIIAKGFNCHYPCATSLSCPMKDQDDWCHQYLKVSHNLEIERLTQITHKNRKWMPITLGLYLKETSYEPSKNFGRIIRTFVETKFGFSWQVCNSKNEIFEVEVLKRHLSKSEIKSVGNFLSGQAIEFDIEKELADNKLRIKLKLGENG